MFVKRHDRLRQLEIHLKKEEPGVNTNVLFPYFLFIGWSKGGIRGGPQVTSGKPLCHLLERLGHRFLFDSIQRALPEMDVGKITVISRKQEDVPLRTYNARANMATLVHNGLLGVDNVGPCWLEWASLLDTCSPRINLAPPPNTSPGVTSGP